MDGSAVFGLIIFLVIVYGVYDYFDKQNKAKIESGKPTKESKDK